MRCRQPRGPTPMRRKNAFPRWLFFISHVEKKNSPRRRETIPRTYRLIPPKFHFTPTWRIFLFHLDISKFLPGDLKIPPWGFFRPNAGGTNSSHEYGTILPSYLLYYIR